MQKSIRRFASIALLASAAAVSPGLSFADAFGLPPAGAAKFTETLATAETIKLLRQGGYTLYLRHGYTDNKIPDRPTGVDLNDCSTQRPLTDEGHKIAKTVGEAIRKARIPVGEIHISPLCRVKDTVADAFPGKTHTIDNKLMYTANLTDAEKAPIIANTRRLLAETPPKGSNRLLIAHAPNLMDLIGYFPKEATLVIFRPKGNDTDFDYLGSIPPTLWSSLD